MADALGFPDATDTGVQAGVALKVYNGDLTIDTPGTVISGLDIHGSVYINADNVTLINCRITSGGYWVVSVGGGGGSTGGTGCIIENCEINGAGGTQGSAGIQGSGTFLANNIYGVENGIVFAGAGNSLAQDNYIHDLQSSPEAHYDGIAAQGGLSNITIRHNTVISRPDATSAVYINNDFGPMSNVIVDNNKLSGGMYTVYSDEKASHTGTITGVQFTNNYLTKGVYGYGAIANNSVVWQGNIDTPTGQTVSQDGVFSSPPSPPPSPTSQIVISGFSTDSGVAGDHITNDNTLTLTGTAAANSTVKVLDGANQIGTATANSSGGWTYTTAALATGTHSLTAKDNAGTTSTALSVTIDTAAPSAPSIVSNTISAGKVTLNGTAEANSTVQVFEGLTQLGTAKTNSSGAWTVTTAALTTGTHNFTAKAMDAAGNNSGTSSATSVAIGTTTTVPVDLVAQTASWSNLSYPTQTTNFTASFDATPSQSGADVVIGLAGTNAAAWTDLAAIVRFNNGNTIDVRNGSGYGADVSVPYSAGTDYHFRMVVNLSTHTYNVYVTPQGGSEIALASNYAFRTEQAADTSLSDVGGFSTSGSAAVHNFSIVNALPGVPGAPTITAYSTDSGTVGDRITNDSTLTLTGTAAANSTVKVLDGANQIGTATANSSGVWTDTTAALTNGAHNLTATATNAAGTGAASAPLSITIDTAAPTAPTIASFSTDTGTAGDHITNDNTLTLTGAAEANSKVTVFDGSQMLGTAIANSSGAWSYTTAALQNGIHNLTATATDAAGNTGSASAALAVTVTAPPGVPTVTSFSPDTGVIGDGITDPAIITLTGGAVANSTVTVYDGAKLLGTATANAGGAWNFTTVPLPDGVHKFTATDTVAGITSAASTAMTVTTDTVNPAAPTIASFSTDTGTAGDHITSDNTLTLTGTAEANSKVTVFDGSQMLGTAIANSSGVWSYTTAALKNGIHNLTATATDAADNTGSASAALAVTVMAPPGVPTIASFSPDTGVVGDGITDPAIITLTGSAVANSTVTVYDGAKLLGTATANAGGAWNFTTVPLPDGVHKFTATDTVADVTSAASTVMTVTTDTVNPVAPTISSFSNDSGTNGDHITNDNTLTLAGVAEANATVTVFDGAKLLGSAVANSSGSWNYTTAALGDGAHSFTAKAMDAAANSSVASAALTVTIDKTAPVAPTIASFSNDSGTPGDHVTDDTTLSLMGTAEASSTVKIYDGANLLGSAVANGSGGWSYTTDTLAFGSHSFSVTDTDAAGNVSATSGALNVSVSVGKPPIAITVEDYSALTPGMGFLQGTAAANSLVWLSDGKSGAALGVTTATDGSWMLPMIGAQSNSVRDFVLQASDLWGNTGSAHFVYGTTGNDAIATSASNDYVYGNGGNDTFVFSGNIGKDTVGDFNANTDIVQMSHNTFTDFAAVLAHATQVGPDVTITVDASNSVTLHNTALSQLTHNNIHVV